MQGGVVCTIMACGQAGEGGSGQTESIARSVHDDTRRRLGAAALAGNYLPVAQQAIG